MIEKNPDIQFVCALGLPLGIPGIINTAMQSNVHIALNGCEVRCAIKALGSASIPVDDEVTLTTDLKIPK